MNWSEDKGQYLHFLDTYTGIGKDNPRADVAEDEDVAALATSIAAIGLVQPLIVIKRGGGFRS